MSDSGRVQRGIERQIEEARKKGAFDNLPGAGKPIPKDDFLGGDDENRLAYKMLNDNNFLLPWMEKGRQIERQFERARKALERSWDMYQRAGGEVWAEDEWQRAEAAFRQQIVEINSLIRDYNLEIPNLRFERFVLVVEEEVKKIRTP